jgi:hypothetical protein
VHLLAQAEAEAEDILTRAKRKHAAAKEHKALLHAREESVDIQSANLGICEENLSMLEDWLNREREALETRENMVVEHAEALAQREHVLSQREASLQEMADRMLVQQRQA